MRKATTPFAPTSFKDAGYKFAISGETTESIARWVLEQNPDFLDGATDEQKAELRAGWALRWQELNPAKTYNAEWVPDDKGGSLVTLDYCFSYSQQAFGQLKNENPVQHDIIGTVRTKFNKYVHNCMADLKAKIRRVSMEGETKTKDPTKDFETFLADTMQKIKARCKTATARGDATAPDEVKLRMAIDAFNAKLK